MNFYNYIYLDLTKPGNFDFPGINLHLNFEPFYVGKGKGRRYKLYAHTKGNRLLLNRINKITHDKIEVVKIESTSEREALCKEIAFIKTIGKYIRGKGSLLNLTDGGEGISGYRHTTESKIKISNASKGKTLSEEQKKKISTSLSGEKHPQFGKKISKEHKFALLNSVLGKKKTAQHIEKVRQSKFKKVAQIDILTGETIRTFVSAKAAMMETKICKITAVCRGERNKAGGYKWEYRLEAA